MPRYVLEIVALLLVVLWLVGWRIVPFAGNGIHLLLVIVLAVVGLRLIQWKKAANSN